MCQKGLDEPLGPDESSGQHKGILLLKREEKADVVPALPRHYNHRAGRGVRVAADGLAQGAGDPPLLNGACRTCVLRSDPSFRQAKPRGYPGRPSCRPTDGGPLSVNDATGV